VLVMTGANSAVGLRSMPVRYLFLDEVDGYPLDVEGEGDAISLAEARTRTLRGARSSSSRRRRSRGERHRARVRGQRPASLLRAVSALLAPAVAALRAAALGQRAPETAAYICESCDTAIAEHHKTWMLEHGEWRAMITDGRARRQAFTCRRCTARWAGAVGVTSPPRGSRRQQGIGIGRRHQDLQEHRTG
jgi:phage terminase large subunit GpA-like protein